MLKLLQLKIEIKKTIINDEKLLEKYETKTKIED